jgi:hypothetical protein
LSSWRKPGSSGGPHNARRFGTIGKASLQRMNFARQWVAAFAGMTVVGMEKC